MKTCNKIAVSGIEVFNMALEVESAEWVCLEIINQFFSYFVKICLKNLCIFLAVFLLCREIE